MERPHINKYEATEPGEYKVVVEGCENCEELETEYYYQDEAKIYLEKYPVPTNDWLKIEMEDKGEYEFEMYNLLGEKFKALKYNLQKGRNILEVNTDDIPSGVYLLKVKDYPEYGMAQILITKVKKIKIFLIVNIKNRKS